MQRYANLIELFSNRDIEILIATQNRQSFDFLEKMFPFVHFSELNIVLVNQTEPHCMLQSDYATVRVINTFEKGLSKSRNVALQNSHLPIGIFTDDDVIFDPKFRENILEAFSHNPKAFAIRMQVQQTDGKYMHTYPKTAQKRLSILQVLQTTSVELVFQRKYLPKDVWFDEHFGLGTTFPMGEEAIWVSDACKTGLQMAYYPLLICTHPQPMSVQKQSISKLYYTQGAFFYRTMGKKWFLWIALKMLIQLKQRKITFRQIPMLYKNAKKGMNDYTTQLTQNV